jgi:hypothetical protein
MYFKPALCHAEFCSFSASPTPLLHSMLMLQLCILPDLVKRIQFVRTPGNFPEIQTVQNLQSHGVYILRGKR